MKTLLLKLLIVSFFLVSCGGGGGKSSTSNTAPVIVNNAPIISTVITKGDISGTNVIRSLESFTLLLKVLDNESDIITGNVSLDNTLIDISKYEGSEDFTHQVAFIIDNIGEYSAVITVSDGVNSNVVLEHNISIIPNETEVLEMLTTEITGFVVGGVFDGESILGVATDEMERNIGYKEGELSEDNLKHNSAPSGQCGINTPHKLLNVEVSAEGIVVIETGVVFPLECLSESQTVKIKQKNKESFSSSNILNAKTNYIAQNFLVTKNEHDEYSISQTGEGINIEGYVDSIGCSEIILEKIDSTYFIPEEVILNKIESLISEDSTFTLQCQRNVLFEGEMQSSPMLATVTGELVYVDNTFPTGSIDSINFTIPYLEGGLDQGDVCVKTTAKDNEEVASEILMLHAEDGLVDSKLMKFSDSAQEYCGSLIGFEGAIYINQTIIDSFGNETINLSESYLVKKNEAPNFSEKLSANITLKINQGIVDIVTKDDVSDPEGQTVTLSGDVSINTENIVGIYEVTAIASDPYNAQSTKTIEVNLTNNSPPEAGITLVGEYSKIGSAIRDINNTITLGLSSSDEDGEVISSKLTTSINNDDEYELINYSSIYSHNLSGEGGTSRTFSYQVTDNDGLESEIAYFVLDIHLNTPPIYSGETEYTAERGTCVIIEQQAIDSEGDDVNFTIEGNKWQLCSDEVTELTKVVKVTDTYLLDSITDISVSFTSCSAGKIWDGEDCIKADTTPDDFSFSHREGEELNTLYGSNIITITGINSPTPISISGGRYSINDFAVDESDVEKYTSGNGTVINGDRVHVIQTSSSQPDTTTTANITIGGISANFKVTTDTLAPVVRTGNNIETFGIENSTTSGYGVIMSGVGRHHTKFQSFLWTQVSGPQELVISQNEDLVNGTYYYRISFPTPVVSDIEEYVFRFTASNIDGYSGFVDWKVTVRPSRAENIIPTANAGPDQTVYSGDKVYLQGSGSDTDGTIEEYAWGQFTTRLASGEHLLDGPVISTSLFNSPTENFTAPEVDEEIIVMLHLRVRDNEGDYNESPNLGTTPASGPSDDIIYITIKPTP